MGLSEIKEFVEIQLQEEGGTALDEILEKVWYFYTSNHPINSEEMHNKVVRIEELL